MKVEIGPYVDGDDEERKVDIRIDSYDTWNMDHTLALIIHPMLIQLKETKQGAPCVDKEDTPESLWPNEAEEALYKKNGQTDIHFFARWDYVLDEMIWAFEQMTIDWEEQYYGEWVEDETKTLGGYSVNADHEGRIAHQYRMAKGFELFGKYYFSLWD